MLYVKHVAQCLAQRKHSKMAAIDRHQESLCFHCADLKLDCADLPGCHPGLALSLQLALVELLRCTRHMHHRV